MKITKETKIKDLFCGFNFDIDPENEYILDATRKTLKIYLKREEVKDFDWYVKEYLSNTTCIEKHTKHNIDIRCWDVVESEFKFGLFSIIAHDVSSLMRELNYFFKYKDFADEIKEICPEDFLNSIFE